MLTPEQRREWIERIRYFPDELAGVVKDLSEQQLTARPLPGEWSVAQNVHHLADSHLNSYIRTRLILTEDYPTLKPYNQETWAELPDAKTPAVEESLSILRGLHHRWAALFASLDESQWARKGYHPENGDMTVESILETYVKHGAGHIDQIQRTLAAG